MIEFISLLLSDPKNAVTFVAMFLFCFMILLVKKFIERDFARFDKNISNLDSELLTLKDHIYDLKREMVDRFDNLRETTSRLEAQMERRTHK